MDSGVAGEGKAIIPFCLYTSSNNNIALLREVICIILLNRAEKPAHFFAFITQTTAKRILYPFLVLRKDVGWEKKAFLVYKNLPGEK